MVGKDGVGKTSLMHKLLLTNVEDLTSSQRSDMIKIGKFNINVEDGKWILCEGKYVFVSVD